jgi:hypothetical protein
MRYLNFSSPIRAKITIPYLILAAIVALGGAYIVTNVIIDTFEERLENNLIEVGKISTNLLVREENALLETLRLITRVDGGGLYWWRLAYSLGGLVSMLGGASP